MPLKIGDKSETALMQAIQSPKISAASFDEIKEVLRFVMLKVGLRAANLPNDIEKLVLIEHIVENYGGNHIQEIKMAFDMAVSGKLDLKPDDVKCYENFSCAYFSVIMNSYRTWAAQAIRAIKVEEPPEQKFFTDEELEDGFREDVERQYGLFAAGHKLRGTEFNVPILQKDGLLLDGESVYDFFGRMLRIGRVHIYERK